MPGRAPPLMAAASFGVVWLAMRIAGLVHGLPYTILWAIDAFAGLALLISLMMAIMEWGPIEVLRSIASDLLLPLEALGLRSARKRLKELLDLERYLREGGSNE